MNVLGAVNTVEQRLDNRVSKCANRVNVPEPRVLPDRVEIIQEEVKRWASSNYRLEVLLELLPLRAGEQRAKAGRYGIDATFQGASGYRRAELHERELNRRAVPHTFRQELGDARTLRFGPVPAVDVARGPTMHLLYPDQPDDDPCARHWRPPNRRCRRPNSESDSSKAVRVNSGKSSSRNTSSV